MGMNESSILQRRWLRWGLILGLWTLMGLFDGYQTFLCSGFVGRSIDFDVAIMRGLVEWSIWAALAPFIFRLARRFPLDQRGWQTSLFFQLLAITLYALLKVALDVPVVVYYRCEFALSKTPLEVFIILFTARFLGYLLICSVILAVSHTVDYHRKYRERELRASQLEARLAQAQLQVLKMQLHPHFLFNTLNAISALMHKNVDEADRMIARLGELLRLALANVGTQEVALQQEIDFIQPYLEIEQARLGPRLKVRLLIDPKTIDAQVPYLILQPLVENAVRHGVARRTENGLIEIRAQRVGRMLELQVRDNGPGLPPGQETSFREGVGLSNTRARLQQVYGAAHRFTLRNGDGGGLVVTLSVPFRELPEDGTPSEPDLLQDTPPKTPAATAYNGLEH
jgi:signal transduction histidine kinase